MEINKKIIKNILIIIFVIYFFIFLIKLSIYFYENYYSCKNLSNYECIEIKYKKRNINYIIEKDGNNKFICLSDYCLSMESVIKNARDGAIENKGIEDLFLESIYNN